MGTGKSTVGLLVAETLGWPFLDTDHLIEAKAGKTVAEIFTQEGEPRFRSLEREVLVQALQPEPVVVATGGGAIMDEANFRRMQQAGFLVALTASAEVISQRVIQGDEPIERPLLEGPNPMAEIRRLIQTRRASYDKADYVINTSQRDSSDVAQLVLQRYAKWADDSTQGS